MIALDNLASPQRRAVDLVKEVAAEKQLRAYLVGGPVRDLLLDRPVIDLDFTVENGSSELARSLAKKINGRVRSYPQFLTYKVSADEFPEIDIATARTEKYRASGALPSVSPGTLQEDLLRRDFSINAIALDVVSGEIHDPTGGQRDIEQKAIRVLHDESFVDDPTRIFRAMRLAARLGFSLEPRTRKLVDSAVRTGALGTVSKERLWRELFLSFEESEPARAIESLSAAGALEVLFGPRQMDRAKIEQAQRVSKQNPALDREVLYIATILYGNASPVDLEGSGLSQRRARVVMQLANELSRFADSLSEATSERQRFRVLKHASPEALAVLADSDGDNIERFRNYQKFQLPLRGTDLEVPLGPHVAKALERAREAVFTGEIGPEEARSFAREMAIKYLNREKIAEQK